ncbi:MAG: hypothetical protein MZV64_41165 [Ignavibacteriales bacterium]|nr:hypothetical protein [Ignavibacteriales bacterium]
MKHRLIANELYVLSLNSLRTSEYFYIAQDLVNLSTANAAANWSKEKVNIKLKDLDSTIASIFPEDLNVDLSRNYAYSDEYVL